MSMYGWRKWIWPGVLSILVLTALANWFRGESIEEELTLRSSEALVAEHPWASVALDRRDLTLRGTSPSPEATEKALELAKDAYGVRVVRDETEALAAASPYRLDIEKTDSGIVLTGNAPDHQTRAGIVKSVEAVAGAASVEDRLELAAGAPAGLAGLATFAAGFLPTLENGKASLTDTDFSVSGQTASLEEFEAMNGRLADLPDGFNLASNGILPPRATPYRWSAAKRDDGVVLRGNVSSDEARATITDLAKSTLGVDVVTDRMQLASGAPDNISDVQKVLLENLAKLEAGQANLVDDTASIGGRVEDTQIAEAVNDAITSGLPEGFNGSTNILVPAPEPVAPEIPLADPFVWNVSKASGGVVVSGNVGSADIAAANVEAAKAALGTDNVSDQQSVARGAPENIDAARAFITGQLGLLDEGNGKVTGTEIVVSGVARDQAVADQIAANFANNLPTGFTGSSRARVRIPVANPYRWSVEKNESGVTVSGNVVSEQAGNSIVDMVKRTTGAADVVNNQTVARGRPIGFNDARNVVTRQLRMLNEGSASIVGKNVFVTGAARNTNIKGLIERSLPNALPQGYSGAVNVTAPESEVVVAKPVEVLPPVANPYTWSVTKTADGIAVGGNVDSEEERGRVLGQLAPLYGGAEITDNQTVARGETAGFDPARIAVARQVRLLEEGQGTITGKNIRITGKVKNKNLAGLIERSLARNLPQGFTTEVSVAAPESEVVVAKPVAKLPPVVDPYAWSISKRASGITVAGNVASEGDANGVISLTKSVMGVSEVTNRQTVARGKPAGFDAARNLVTRQVRILEEGQGTILGNEVRVTGKVKNKNLVGLVERGVTKGLPDGYEAIVNVTAPESKVVVAKPVAKLPPVVDPYAWSISKRASGITVAGNVASEGDANGVISLTKSVMGVSEVTNRQTVARGKPAGFDAARNLVTRQVRILEEGQGTILGNEVRVTGKVKNRNLVGLVERGVKKGLPDGYEAIVNVTAPESEVVIAKPVEVLPDIANPYRWSVSKTSNGVTVTGNVASEAIGAQVIDQTTSVLGVDTVSNRQTVARGKPDGFDSARAHILDQVNRLEAGQGNIVGKVLSVTGRASSEAVRNTIDNAVTGGSPAGYTGSTNIVFPKPAPQPEPKPEPEPEPEEVARACQQNIVAAVNGRKIQFETARAIIRNESLSILDDVVKVAQECPEVRFQIAGHTDSRGRDAYNQGLSEARANAVVQFLSNAGVDSARLDAKGFGEAEPIADNNTPEGRAENRRIEFRVIQ